MADSIPFTLRPLQPTLVRPFHRDGSVFEVKIDGWRIVAYKSGRQVRLISRTGIPALGDEVFSLRVTKLPEPLEECLFWSLTVCD